MLFWLTFAGLYMELCGAFLLAAEAIGPEHLLRAGEFLRRRRLVAFAVYFLLVILLLVLVRLELVFRVAEAFILIVSLGLLHDFAPQLFRLIVRYLKRGTAGVLGFLLFSAGFVIQAYVTLMLLK